MKTEMMTLEEVRVKGFHALVEALGVVDAIRFIHQYEHGSGDYTRDRYAHLGDKTPQEIYDEIQAAKADGGRKVD